MQRADRLEQDQPVAARVDIDNQAVDLVELAAEEPEGLGAVAAQPHTMRGAGRGFQNDAAAIGIGIH